MPGTIRRMVLRTVAGGSVLLGTLVPALAATPVTCGDWLAMPPPVRAGYVHGMVEGVTVTAVLTTAALLPQLPPAEQLAAAEEVAEAIVADASVEAYVEALTGLCEAADVPREAPLAPLFLAAGDRLRARGPSAAVTIPPAHGDPEP